MAITAWISVRNFCPDADSPREARRVRSGSARNGLASQRLSGTPAVVPCRLDETPERLA